MDTVKFESIECQTTGEIGMAPAGMKIHEDYIASTVGFTIAHDLIEHPNGMEKIGGVGDELEATGCIWFTRGQHSDMARPERSIWSPEEACAHEVCHNFEYWWNRGCEFDMPVPRSKPSLYDQNLISIIHIGIKYIKDYVDSQWAAPYEEGKPTTTDIATYISACKHFMRSGILKQQARFPLFEYQANNEFWNVVEAVEPFAKSLDVVGQTFDLKWDDDGYPIMVETFQDEMDYDEDDY